MERLKVIFSHPKMGGSEAQSGIQRSCSERTAPPHLSLQRALRARNAERHPAFSKGGEFRPITSCESERNSPPRRGGVARRAGVVFKGILL